MKFGEKLSRLRKEQNYTQEQFADILGVSRQTVSKWESDIAFPETEKLIRISEMFDCSIDYLLKESVEEPHSTSVKPDSFTDSENAVVITGAAVRERKSKKTVFGMPLWHISKKARGFIAIGLDAKGVIAIGLSAKGIISIGLLSLGMFSVDLCFRSGMRRDSVGGSNMRGNSVYGSDSGRRLCCRRACKGKILCTRR